ncbi:MAG: CxxxxCH/CxxCH domain-containing protein, partial [Desulfuromonadaceae bacterium]
MEPAVLEHTMKSMVITLLTAVALFLSPVGQAAAVTPAQPHDFMCVTCHSPHKTLGNTGYDNVCLNCHRGGDPRGGAKSFAPGDAADPFGRYTSGVSNRFQISHRWDGSDTRPDAGALPPVQPRMTSVRGRTSGSLACVRCHSPHSQDNKPFLRIANDSDQMCLDCHRSWNTADHTKGTHPVGVDYLQKASANPSAFNPSPVNANPSNPTSAMKLLGGKVSCSSCHGVHATDSNSSTFDSFSSLSDLQPSDGSLLRTDRRAATANGINICTNCHAGKVAHNGRGQDIQCSDCHGAHVDLGDGSVPNVWLVKRNMGPGRGQVFFNSTTVKNYMSSDNSGVCQSCHAVPTGSGYQFHLTQTNATCNDCHAHGNSSGSFSVGAVTGCTACHGYPPLANIAGSGGYAAGYVNAPSFTDESVSGHGSHASTPYQKACVNCHNGNNHQDGIYQDVFNVTTGTVAATGGLSPVYDKAAQTCSTVYCHSNANPRGGTNSTITTPSWNGGKGTIIGTAGECGTCHSAAGATLPTWSVSHSKHINGYAANPNFTCTVCHAGTASGNSAIFGTITARSLHTNGVKDVVFNSFANGGTWDPTSAACSNLYCHSNVQGAGGVGAPITFTSVWNGAVMTCGSCHASMVKLSNISTATGSHKRHVQGYNYDCSACHGTGYSVTNSSAPVVTHVDGFITIGFTGTAATNGATPSYYQGNNSPGNGYEYCSNSYCHSNVQGSGGVGAPSKFAAPVWGAGPVDCGLCHANMATNTAATGSHVKHAQTAGYSCPTCHNGAGKDPNPPFAATAKHADGTIEISFSGSAVGAAYSKGGGVIPGTGYGACSTAVCHGYGIVPWGGTLWSATDQCGMCHSSPTSGAITQAVPFYNTSYPTKVTINTDAKVGAHTNHMSSQALGISASTACTDCHGTVTLSGATHMNGSTTFAWSNLATKTGTLVPAYNSGTGQCTTTYCHGNS